MTPHFWLNVVDETMAIPGIIEFSNLRPTPETIIYVPYYMPTDNPKFAASDETFVAESFGYLKRINPALADSTASPRTSAACATRNRCASRASRRNSRHPHGDRRPAIADTCFYYPEDRGISESARVAKEMAMAIGTGHQPRREPVFGA